jgi:ABC-type nitrate/sulfonate/bicarbonate transport system substrate-binding protein
MVEVEMRISGRLGPASLVLFALALSACGSSGDSPPQTTKTLTPLRVGLSGGAALAGALPLYVADTAGYYKDEGLDVTVKDNLGTNATNAVVAGQYDVGFSSTLTPLFVADQGKATSIVYGIARPGAGGTLLLKSGLSIDALRHMKGCKLSSLSPGSANYGYALSITSQLRLDCQVVVFTSRDAQIGALKAGKVQGVYGNYEAFAPLVEDGIAELAIDLRDPAERTKYVGKADYSPAVLWGLTDALSQKRDSVEAFLRAVNKAGKLIESSTPEKLASLLVANPNFKDIPEALILVKIKDGQAFLATNQGLITPENWDVGLQEYAKWGLPKFDPTSKVYDFDSRIDMSYNSKG